MGICVFRKDSLHWDSSRPSFTESGLLSSMTSPAGQIQDVTQTAFQPKQDGMQSQEWERPTTRKWRRSWPLFRRSIIIRCMFDRISSFISAVGEVQIPQQRGCGLQRELRPVSIVEQ